MYMQAGYLHKLFNDQKNDEMNYDMYTGLDENTVWPPVSNPMKETRDKWNTLQMISTTAPKGSHLPLHREDSQGFALFSQNAKSDLRNSQVQVPTLETESPYTSEYLLTDTDIDIIVDYYKTKKKKKNFVDLFTSKMFLRKFKEPYKDDKVYEKYILKVLKEIQDKKESSKKNEKKCPKTIFNEKKELEELEELEDDQDEDDDEKNKKVDVSDSVPFGDEWKFMVLWGHLQRTKDSWSIQLSTFRESKPAATTSLWRTIQNFFSSK